MLSKQSLLREIEETIKLYEETIGAAASRTRPMVEQYGPINALSKLVISPNLQQGFKALRDRGQLNRSFEALVVKYPHFFSNDAVEAAQWRLDNEGKLLGID